MGSFWVHSWPGGGGFGFAYYPLGVASRRYVLSEGGLALQTLRPGRTRTEWTLALEGAHGSEAPATGTLRRVLKSFGFRAPRRLSRAQATSLDAVRAFAEYRSIEYGEPYGDALWARIVRSDGTRTRGEMVDPDPLHLKRAYAPILAEEAAMLGLGRRAWHGSGGLSVVPPPAEP